jgi:hypothetical protein
LLRCVSKDEGGTEAAAIPSAKCDSPAASGERFAWATVMPQFGRDML